MKKADVIDAMLMMDAQEAAENAADGTDAPEDGAADSREEVADTNTAGSETAATGQAVQDSHGSAAAPEKSEGSRKENRQQRPVRRVSIAMENGHRETDGERNHRTYRQNNGSYNNGRSGSRENNGVRGTGATRENNRERENGAARENNRERENSAMRENSRERENTSATASRTSAPASAQEETQSQNRVSAPAPRYGERYNSPYNRGTAPILSAEEDKFPAELDSGITVKGILEVMSEGYGFIRSDNYMPGDSDIYVAPSQIRRFNLRTGDILEGNTRVRTQNEKFSALLYVKTINGYTTEEASKRSNFEDMTPIFPDSRLKMERYGCPVAMRVMDLLSPIGKGQRGMIVSPPKAGKTTLLKEVAMSVKKNYPDLHLIILLIDERPEEVTDMKETVAGPNVEVIYSTFDELPEHHKRVSEMVIERAKRLVEHKKDVMILLDSITRLTRAYNLVVPPSGRTLSGGIDPAALHMPKRFFGAARNMREGGSLTILATALVDTGSKMDDVIYEEFKGTGNMELVLDRKLSERRIFPAIDIPKTSTRREDLLLSAEEMEAINIVRRALNGMKSDDAVDKVLDLFARTRTNTEFVQTVKKMRYL